MNRLQNFKPASVTTAEQLVKEIKEAYKYLNIFETMEDVEDFLNQYNGSIEEGDTEYYNFLTDEKEQAGCYQTTLKVTLREFYTDSGLNEEDYALLIRVDEI